MVFLVAGRSGQPRGVGPLGSTTRFDLPAVAVVTQEVGPVRGEVRMVPKRIVLGATLWFRFGELLSPTRREYMFQALRTLLNDRGPIPR